MAPFKYLMIADRAKDWSAQYGPLRAQMHKRHSATSTATADLERMHRHPVSRTANSKLDVDILIHAV